MTTLRTQVDTEQGFTVRSLTPDRRFDHYDRMLTEIGIWQHAQGIHPDKKHGYSIDDEARGLIVGLQHWKVGTESRFNQNMAETCFRFIQDAALTNGPNKGRYHNFCDQNGRWLDKIGSQDSFGRTLWALGVAYHINAPFLQREDIARLLNGSLPNVADLTYLRSKAFVILGLAASRLNDTLLCTLANELADSYEKTHSDDWRWFENHMTYCNARLPQAMFAASVIFPEDTRFLRIGQESLDFLLEVTRTEKSSYAPIGNEPMEHAAWFIRGHERPPRFDQQPVDAGALVECCALAYECTHEPRFRKAAADAFGWYLGDNHHGLPIYDFTSGGVCDALTRTGVSANQGAESVISIHLAQQALDQIM